MHYVCLQSVSKLIFKVSMLALNGFHTLYSPEASDLHEQSGTARRSKPKLLQLGSTPEVNVTRLRPFEIQP